MWVNTSSTLSPASTKPAYPIITTASPRRHHYFNSPTREGSGESTLKRRVKISVATAGGGGSQGDVSSDNAVSRQMTSYNAVKTGYAGQFKKNEQKKTFIDGAGSKTLDRNYFSRIKVVSKIWMFIFCFLLLVLRYCRFGADCCGTYIFLNVKTDCN